MVRSSKSSKPRIVLASLLGGLLASSTAMVSVARAAEPAAEPEAAPSDGGSASVPQRSTVTIEEVRGADLPPQLAADIRVAIEDVLAGRALPGTPIEVTLETGGAVVRVGSLWRRIPTARWDYSAVRTVALHVLDLLQPAPEVRAGAPAHSTPDPSVAVVTQTRASEPSEAAAPGGPWSLHASVAGARGVQGPDPWMVSFAIGAAWSRDWLRIGAEIGWDHAMVRHPDGMTTVNYDAVPVRLVVAAQNHVVMAGVRAGVAGYRVTGQQAFREVTPLVGPFLAARVPIAGRIRGLLIAGFDYFGRRTELSMGGFDTAYSTPQLAPYVGVVVEAVLGQ